MNTVSVAARRLAWPAVAVIPADLPPAIICQAPRAIDGDTLACANLPKNVRLAGIDAPELHRCRRGRVCTPGDGRPAAAALAALLRSGTVRLQLKGDGGFGRHLAVAWVGRVNVNCAMLARRMAVRRYSRLSC